MVDYTTDELLTILMARQVTNKDVMIVGVATPIVWSAFTLAKVTHAPDAIFHYLMGNTFVWEARQVSLLWLELGAASRCHRLHNTGECTLELLPHDILTTIEFFRPAQIDQFGNTNNTVIGDWHKPKVRLPGAAGIPDFSGLYSAGQHLYVPRHDKRTFVPAEKLFFRSGVGFVDGTRPLTDYGLIGRGPKFVITNLAYLDFDPKEHRMRIKTVHPGVTVEEVQENTGFELLKAPDLKETRPPTETEVRILREKVDPLGIRKLEVLTGKERAELLGEIIRKEYSRVDRMPPRL
ncbi:MAG: CoA-transferase subunit beta [Candidatus Helarchaeota archaeon]